LCWKVIRHLQKRVLYWNFVPNTELRKFRNCTSSVASLSHGASTFVYNTIGVTQHVTRICLRQDRYFFRTKANLFSKLRENYPQLTDIKNDKFKAFHIPPNLGKIRKQQHSSVVLTTYMCAFLSLLLICSFFYRATLCYRGIYCGHVSVRRSVRLSLKNKHWRIICILRYVTVRSRFSNVSKICEF